MTWTGKRQISFVLLAGGGLAGFGFGWVWLVLAGFGWPALAGFARLCPWDSG
jgi:hypothetical protein